MSNLAKIVVKVYDEETRKTGWEHFGYLDAGLKDKLTSRIQGQAITPYLEKWAEEDFKEKFDLGKKQEVEMLKSLVKERCYVQYPHIYVQTPTDRQGWLRVWMNGHAEREVENFEQD